MTTAKQFMISDSSINVVYQAEQEIGTLKGQNRDNNDAANGQKMTAYGEVIASIAQVKLVKGNLPRSVSKTLRKALLEEAGLKDATVKRYVENGVGAVRLIKEKIGDIPSQYTGSAVVADLVAMDIDSENKLAKAIKGEGEKSKAQMLAEKVVGKFSNKKDENGKMVQGDVFRDGLDDEIDALLMREAGFPVPADPEIGEKLVELRFLEKSLGKTGRLALSPILHTTSHRLWQLHLLR